MQGMFIRPQVVLQLRCNQSKVLELGYQHMRLSRFLYRRFRQSSLPTYHQLNNILACDVKC
jgi:hypothetical protein